MKILLTLPNLGSGGTERVATSLVSAWIDDGHEVTIATFAGGADFYPVPSTVARVHLPEAGGAGGLWRRVRALRQKVRTTRPDVVVAFMTTSSVMTLLATWRLGVRVVISERSWPPAMPLGRMWQMLRKVTYRYADAVVVLTERTRRWALAELALAPERLHVIANPVRWPLPTHEPVLEPPAHRFVLAVGRLGPEKRFAAAIDACQELDVDLVILGEGPLRESLQAHARRKGVRLMLPGRAGNPGAWYQAAYALVLTSEFEGFPNVLIEALSHGCPVVSFDIEVGPREIVRDGEDGLLIPAGDVHALREALERLLAEPAYREQLASAAPAVRQRYAWDTIQAQWTALLKASGDD